jgi:hypothetical protein
MGTRPGRQARDALSFRDLFSVLDNPTRQGESGSLVKFDNWILKTFDGSCDFPPSVGRNWEIYRSLRDRDGLGEAHFA